MIKKLVFSVSVAVSAPLAAQTALSADEAATRFGARENVLDIALSPDGKKVAYVVPRDGQGSAVYSVDLAGGEPKLVTAADGKPLQLFGCNWVSGERMVCSLGSIQKYVGYNVGSTRLVAINADGTDPKLVSESTRRLFGGDVIDWLPAEQNNVLMVSGAGGGISVIRKDTVTGKTDTVVKARNLAVDYMSDGRGTIRILVTQPTVADYASEELNFFYRTKASEEWRPLDTYHILDRDGFLPLAVDGEKDIVYGLKKKGGRQALYSRTLDGNMTEQLLFEHPSVDVDNVVTIGRNRRVIGVSYVTDVREVVYLDKSVESMDAALSKALPGLSQLQVVDSSVDGDVMLLWGGGDVNPGEYYVYDRAGKRLNKILLSRSQLEGVALAPMKPVTFKASDGTAIPGYLTLPPGKESAKGLPAIVMPHGGPESRDEWGFSWLVQFYANRGYAVLQPQFRGSVGYGDAWFQENGYQSWRTAIGDVVDAGRWLIAEGLADPAKLAIVGWSYGGYAALQSGVVAPDLFKAIVAIAPVTDFQMHINSDRYTAGYRIARERMGSGPHIKEGSPAQNVAAIKAPVLMFHGDFDQNVDIKQARFMADKLRDAGKKGELVEFPGLAHSLGDSKARAQLLKQSDQFLRTSMGL